MYLFFVAVTGRPRSRMYNTQGRLSQRPVSFDERDYQSRYAKNLLYESEGNSIMDQLMWPEYLPRFLKIPRIFVTQKPDIIKVHFI